MRKKKYQPSATADTRRSFAMANGHGIRDGFTKTGGQIAGLVGLATLIVVTIIATLLNVGLGNSLFFGLAAAVLVYGFWAGDSYVEVPAERFGISDVFGELDRLIESGPNIIWKKVEGLRLAFKARMEGKLEFAGVLTEAKVRPVDIVNPLTGAKDTENRVHPQVPLGVQLVAYLSLERTLDAMKRLVENGPEGLFAPGITLDAFVALIVDEIEETILSQLRAVIGTMDYEEVMDKRDEIAAEVKVRILASDTDKAVFIRLGIDITKIDIQVKHVELPQKLKDAKVEEAAAEAEKQAENRRSEAEKIKILRLAEAEELRIQRLATARGMTVREYSAYEMELEAAKNEKRVVLALK